MMKLTNFGFEINKQANKISINEGKWTNTIIDNKNVWSVVSILF